MRGDYAEMTAELRALAEAVLDRLEPVLQQAAAAHSRQPTTPEGVSEASVGRGCSWCPLCALAALIRGEHHDLIAFLATHAATLLALLRELLDDHGRRRSGDSTPPSTTPPPGTPPSTSDRPGFVPITVTIKR